MHDRAGALYERMGLIQPAMDAYCRGHAYRQACEVNDSKVNGVEKNVDTLKVVQRSIQYIWKKKSLCAQT